MQYMLASLWCPKEGMTIRDLGDKGTHLFFLSCVGFEESARGRSVDVLAKLTGVSSIAR